MDKQPVISIIVPVYKAEKYLHRCVDSLLAQTFTDYEILLIDDGSPDRSGMICDEYAAKDSRIRVFHKKNGGVSSARNLGLENIGGNYVTFVDADDCIDVDSFEKAVCIMEKENLDILQFSYKMIHEQNNYTICVRDYECVPMGWKKFVQNDHYIVCVWGNFIRSSIIKIQNLRFDESLHLAEDQIFIMKAICSSTRISQTKEFYYNYFQNMSSASHNPCAEDIVNSSKVLLEFVRYNYLFKPHIDRMISNFYIELLLINKRKVRALNSIYKEANIKLNNLNKTSFKILYVFSYFGMDIASKIVAIYLKIRMKFI